MNTSIKTPTDFSYHNELIGFIEQLETFLPIEAVYLSHKPPYDWVVVLTSQNIQHIPPQLFSYTHTFSSMHTHLKIRVYGVSYAAISFEKGCSFFVQHLFFGHCIYGDPLQWLADCKLNMLPTILQKSKDHIDYELNKVRAFLSAALMHQEQGTFAVAAFNYHQSIELFFRVAEWLLIGKSKITHRILSHITYLEAFDDCFTDLLTLENPETKQLFDKLDNAYSNARYSDDFTVGKDELEAFQVMATQLISLAQQRFNRQLAHLQELLNQRNLHTKKKKETLLQGTVCIDEPSFVKAIGFLKKQYDLQQAYLLHQHCTSIFQTRYLVSLSDTTRVFNSYTVVLFTPTAIPLSPEQLTETLYEQSHRGCKLYCICYTVQEAKESMQEGDNFLCHIRDRAKEVYYHTFSLATLQHKAVYYKPLWQTMLAIWEIRYRRAKHLCSIFDYEQYLADPSAQLSILHTAFCQIYLGVLYVFWAFAPKRYSLAYLIALCNSTTSLPYQGFDFSVTLPPHWYAYLLNTPEYLEKGEPAPIHKEDIDQMAQHCAQCIDHCQKLAEAELERVKPLYFGISN